MVQAARGLDDLHTRAPSIVHRDLKLANLMLDDTWDVRLIDFGLAKMVGIKQEDLFFGGMVSPGVGGGGAGAYRGLPSAVRSDDDDDDSDHDEDGDKAPHPLYEMTGGTVGLRTS